MKTKHFTFDFVEKKIRSKTFGVLTTLNDDGSPHTTGILFTVSPPEDQFAIYFLTSHTYKKVRNLTRKPHVSFLIPFPHYWIRFAPAGTITITGKIEFLSLENKNIVNIFHEKRILRLVITQAIKEKRDNFTFLKLIPNVKILCFGVGYSILELRKAHTEGAYSVLIPESRR